MKKISLNILLLALLYLSISCEQQPIQSTSNNSEIEDFTDDLFNKNVEDAQISGGAIMVIHKGEVIVDKAYGYANLEFEVPMPQDGTFEIGSVTKQFTSAAILKLVEDEKLSLEDDFRDYLDFDTKGRKITINQLMNHTSGIASYTELPEFWAFSVQEHSRDSLVRIIEQNDFLFEPGEALIYNNSAYYFLGLIIEKVSEQTYEDYLKEQLFDPLEMNNTYYTSNSIVRKNRVFGYNYNEEGLQQKPYLNNLWPYAAGSLSSTTSDLAKWLQGLHTGKILTETQYKSLITPDPLNDGTPVSYAKGLVNFKDNGHSIIAHGGGIHGFLTETRYYTDEDLYVVVLISTTGPKGAGFFADAVTWEILDKITTESADIDFDLNSITGTYSGQARGRKVSLIVKALENGISTQVQGRDKVDTLSTYLGNHTWLNGNNKITIKDGSYRVDQIYNFYKLEKE